MDPRPMDLFARRLRREREGAGVDPGDLSRLIAERTGKAVDLTLVERMEDQTHPPGLDEAVIAAEELGVSITALVSEEPDLELEGQAAELEAERTVAEERLRRAGIGYQQALADMVRIEKDLQVVSAHAGGATKSRTQDGTL